VENKEPSQRDLENQEILETAQESYNESGGIYGLENYLKMFEENSPNVAETDCIESHIVSIFWF